MIYGEEHLEIQRSPARARGRALRGVARVRAIAGGRAPRITNGTGADFSTLRSRSAQPVGFDAIRGDARRSKSLICVPLKTSGVTIARKLVKLGVRSSDTAELVFDDVRKPQRSRIGREGVGFGPGIIASDMGTLPRR
jgi:hypothetical protein